MPASQTLQKYEFEVPAKVPAPPVASALPTVAVAEVWPAGQDVFTVAVPVLQPTSAPAVTAVFQ